MQRIIAKTWVCTLCAQGFTRQSSARRHNTSLHNGHAKIVRPFEYLNGMLNGTFPSPANPIDFRRERRREKLMGRENTHRLVNQYGPPSNPANRDSYDTYYREPLFPEFQTNCSPYEDKSSGSFLAMKSKLQELRRLLNRRYTPLDATQILKTTAMSISGGREDILDEWLNYLRIPY
jgi:hypothetical protein